MMDDIDFNRWKASVNGPYGNTPQNNYVPADYRSAGIPSPQELKIRQMEQDNALAKQQDAMVRQEPKWGNLAMRLTGDTIPARGHLAGVQPGMIPYMGAPPDQQPGMLGQMFMNNDYPQPVYHTEDPQQLLIHTLLSGKKYGR